MSRHHHQNSDDPSIAELDAIEAEWLIAAELDVLDAQIANLNAADHGGPSELDWRRLRRAEARVLAVAAELAARPSACRAARRRRHASLRSGPRSAPSWPDRSPTT